jgi:hypothetical protein
VRDCRFSVEHDGVSIVVLASPEAAPVYTAGSYPFPSGAIVVKKEYADSACTELVGYTAMKKTGTGSTAQDWTWQRTDAQRVVDPTASAQRCINCHLGCTQGRDLTCADP